MRYCYRAIWTCLLISDACHLKWKWLLSFKTHELCFICIHVETNAPCCLLQVMQQGLDLGRCIQKKCSVICVVSICYSFCRISSTFCLFYAVHCWRSRDELISDVLLWTPTCGRAKAGRPARTYIQQICEDTGCSPEDLPEAMNDREKWRERVRDIRARGTTWWWWWWWWLWNHFLLDLLTFEVTSLGRLYVADVHPGKISAKMAQKSRSPSGEWTISFVFLLSIIIAVTVSLERPYARSICPIFLLCIESNALEKSTYNSVASRFFLHARHR